MAENTTDSVAFKPKNPLAGSMSQYGAAPNSGDFLPPAEPSFKQGVEQPPPFVKKRIMDAQPIATPAQNTPENNNFSSKNLYLATDENIENKGIKGMLTGGASLPFYAVGEALGQGAAAIKTAVDNPNIQYAWSGKDGLKNIPIASTSENKLPDKKTPAAVPVEARPVPMPQATATYSEQQSSPAAATKPTTEPAAIPMALDSVNPIYKNSKTSYSDSPVNPATTPSANKLADFRAAYSEQGAFKGKDMDDNSVNSDAQYALNRKAVGLPYDKSAANTQPIAAPTSKPANYLKEYDAPGNINGDKSPVTVVTNYESATNDLTQDGNVTVDNKKSAPVSYKTTDTIGGVFNGEGINSNSAIMPEVNNSNPIAVKTTPVTTTAKAESAIPYAKAESAIPVKKATSYTGAQRDRNGNAIAMPLASTTDTRTPPQEESFQQTPIKSNVLGGYQDSEDFKRAVKESQKAILNGIRNPKSTGAVKAAQIAEDNLKTLFGFDVQGNQKTQLEQEQLGQSDLAQRRDQRTKHFASLLGADESGKTLAQRQAEQAQNAQQFSVKTGLENRALDIKSQPKAQSEKAQWEMAKTGEEQYEPFNKSTGMTKSQMDAQQKTQQAEYNAKKQHIANLKQKGMDTSILEADFNSQFGGE
jgi:hypothetical protein